MPRVFLTVVEALRVSSSVDASPMNELPRSPAVETKVEEAVTVRKSVEASPIKASPVEPNLVRVVEAETVRLANERPVPCP